MKVLVCLQHWITLCLQGFVCRVVGGSVCVCGCVCVCVCARVCVRGNERSKQNITCVTKHIFCLSQTLFLKVMRSLCDSMGIVMFFLIL
jgi:hypothetical protein